jgi:hypothetical protein
MFGSPGKIPETLILSELAYYDPLMFPGQSRASCIRRPGAARKGEGSIPLRPTRSALLAGAALACALPIAGPALAHGFGQRYSLPIPLWLYLTGAGLTVAASFAMIAVFVRRARRAQDYKRIDLMRLPIGRVLGAPGLLLGLRLLGAGLYLLVIVAGLFGTQSPLKNIAPAMVWAIWWVGMAYVSALLGNLWALVNPLDTLFAAAESLYGRLRPGQRLTLGLHYPEILGVWPAVALFLVFIWMEMAWEASDHPASLAAAMLVYSALTWLGMLLFGRSAWLRRGEVFSLVFGLLARFAPTESRVASAREWTLRPYAVGLVTPEPLPASQTALVLLMLASVSFDGFRDTPAWAAVVDLLGHGLHESAQILGLAGLASLFGVVYFGFCRLIVRWGESHLHPDISPAPGRPVTRIAGLFVLTLVPIAIAYHLAHYLFFLVMAAQYLIPLASDPLGFGWDIFGTRNYFIRIGVIDARVVWYVSVAAIVTGHVAALYVAHLQAMREFPDRRSALRSQWPMLVLMVCYTMVSLWIIAQPIVTSG